VLHVATAVPMTTTVVRAAFALARACAPSSISFFDRHLALLITDFQRPFVHMMLQRLQVPRQFLRATPHRGLPFGVHIQLEYAIGQYRIAGEDPTGAPMLAYTSGPMHFGDWMCWRRSPRQPNAQSDTVQLNA
jgi:hypothetical protein